jgi:predicted dehydrogenase
MNPEKLAMSSPRRLSADVSGRRSFLKKSTLGVATGNVLALARSAHAAGGDVLRIGLIGCGGRGNGAAAQALLADKNTKLVALGDAFSDQLQRSRSLLKQHDKIGDRVEVNDDHCFVGFDAYKQVIASDVDIVLLASPPHFRPQHLAAAVEAGKHVFAEKPVAVDALGVQKVLEACALAKRNSTAVVSGLCWRYSNVARASIQQIHDGAVGEIVALEATYNASLPGKAWPMVRESGWSDMEWQMRNWYWFTWLSGDHIVEQAVHSIDKIAWALHDKPPVSAVSLGGLQARFGDPRSILADAEAIARGARKSTGGSDSATSKVTSAVDQALYGDASIFDHHSVTYEYPGGIPCYFNCRQQPGTTSNVSSRVLGTKGICNIEDGKITSRSGEKLWRYRGPKNVMHQTEHDEMYAALRSGKIVNDGDFMCGSTLLAIMGRLASYSGKKLSWQQAQASKENLSPAKYEWGPAPKAEIAVPGVTPLV